jgi:putative transposase
VTSSVVYDQKRRPQKAVDEFECMLLNKLDEKYTRHPFYGLRRMTKYLCGCGYVVNRKRVQRLMQTLGLAGMASGHNPSKPHPEHKFYPYLLRGLAIIRPNQVWITDITYLRLWHGFVYTLSGQVFDFRILSKLGSLGVKNRKLNRAEYI